MRLAGVRLGVAACGQGRMGIGGGTQMRGMVAVRKLRWVLGLEIAVEAVSGGVFVVTDASGGMSFGGSFGGESPC